MNERESIMTPRIAQAASAGSETRHSILIDSYGARTRLQFSDEVVEPSRNGDAAWYGTVSKKQLHVLVADDCRDAADSLSVLAKLWGHEVSVAYDGAAALAMASASQADVLLLDIAMPKLDGYHVARQLRRQARFADTLLIAITGWADRASRLLGEEAGFDLYLIEPVEPSTLEVLLGLEQERLARSSAARPAVAKQDSRRPRPQGCLSEALNEDPGGHEARWSPGGDTRGTASPLLSLP